MVQGVTPHTVARDMIERRAGLHRLLAAMLDAAPAIPATALLRAGVSEGSVLRSMPPVASEEGE